MNDIDEINWADIKGNKWLKKLEPQMLTSFGLKTRQCFNPVGRPGLNNTSDNQATWYDVVYDKQYVVEYIIRNVIKALNIPNLEYLINLIMDVWIEYNSHIDRAYEETKVFKEVLEEIKKLEAKEVEEF